MRRVVRRCHYGGEVLSNFRFGLLVVLMMMMVVLFGSGNFMSVEEINRTKADNINTIEVHGGRGVVSAAKASLRDSQLDDANSAGLSTSTERHRFVPTFKQGLVLCANSVSGSVNNLWRTADLKEQLDESSHGNALISAPFEPEQQSLPLFGVLATASGMLERVFPALDTWLYDVDSILFVELEDFVEVVKKLAQWQRQDKIGLRCRVFALSKPESDTRSIGGAWKNLLVMRYLHQFYPRRSWYGVVDEDTYIIQHNLMRLLSNFSSVSKQRGNKKSFPPQPPVYLGVMYPSSPRFPLDSFNFAQGGGGYFYNTVAAEKIQYLLVGGTCNRRCDEHPHGDMRAGCCFHQLKKRQHSSSKNSPIREEELLIISRPEFWHKSPFTAVVRDKRQANGDFPVSFHHMKQATWIYDTFWLTTPVSLWGLDANSRPQLIEKSMPDDEEEYFRSSNNAGSAISSLLGGGMNQALKRQDEVLGLEKLSWSARLRLMMQHHDDLTRYEIEKDWEASFSLKDRLLGPSSSLSTTIISPNASWALSPQWLGCRQLQTVLLSYLPQKKRGQNKDFLCNIMRERVSSSEEERRGGGEVLAIVGWFPIEHHLAVEWRGSRYNEEEIYVTDAHDFNRELRLKRAASWNPVKIAEQFLMKNI